MSTYETPLVSVMITAEFFVLNFGLLPAGTNACYYACNTEWHMLLKKRKKSVQKCIATFHAVAIGSS